MFYAKYAYILVAHIRTLWILLRIIILHWYHGCSLSDNVHLNTYCWLPYHVYRV